MKKLSALFISLAFTYLAMEGLMRIVDSRIMIYDMEMWKYAVLLKEKAADPLLRHVHIPGGTAHLMGVDVKINSKRLRDNEYPYEKPEGVYRILVLGDSLAFGWGVPFEETYAKRLEKLLNGADPASAFRYEVINAGVGNWNTVQETEWLATEGLKYDPDMVLLGYYLNDAEPIIESRFDEDSPAHLSHLFVFLWTRLSKLRLIFDDTLHFARYYNNLYRDGAGWADCQKAFGRLSGLLKENDIVGLAVIFPDLHVLDPDRYPFQEAHAAIRKLAASSGLSYLELFDVYKGLNPEALVVAKDDAHPNGRANLLAAEAIFNRFRKSPPYDEDAGAPNE